MISPHEGIVPFFTRTFFLFVRVRGWILIQQEGCTIWTETGPKVQPGRSEHRSFTEEKICVSYND